MRINQRRQAPPDTHVQRLARLDAEQFAAALHEIEQASWRRGFIYGFIACAIISAALWLSIGTGF